MSATGHWRRRRRRDHHGNESSDELNKIKTVRKFTIFIDINYELFYYYKYDLKYHLQNTVLKKYGRIIIQIDTYLWQLSDQT